MAKLGALISWGGYGFIVLDTLARCIVGGDENSSKDMGMVVDRLYHLLDRTPGRNGVVLAVHHTGKDGKTLRGSSALEAGVDTVYSVNRDGGTVTLNREKRKDGPEQDTHELKLDLIEDTGSGVLAVHQGVDKPERAERLLSIFVHHFSTRARVRPNCAPWPNCHRRHSIAQCLTCSNPAIWSTMARRNARSTGRSSNEPVHLCPPLSIDPPNLSIHPPFRGWTDGHGQIKRSDDGPSAAPAPSAGHERSAIVNRKQRRAHTRCRACHHRPGLRGTPYCGPLR